MTIRAHGVEAARAVDPAIEAFVAQVGVTAVLDALAARAEPASARQIGPVGSVYFRSLHFPGQGSRLIGHLHHYDHATFVSRGSLACVFRMLDGTSREAVYTAPAIVLIEKDTWHEFTALTGDVEAHCIFAHRDKDGGVVNEWNGNLEASQAR